MSGVKMYLRKLEMKPLGFYIRQDHLYLCGVTDAIAFFGPPSDDPEALFLVVVVIVFQA